MAKMLVHYDMGEDSVFVTPLGQRSFHHRFNETEQKKKNCQSEVGVKTEI